MQAVLARAAAQREDFQRADSPAVEGAEVEGDSIAGPAALGSPLPLPPAATGVADLPPTVPSSRLVSVSTSEDATLESTLELPLPTSPSDQTANTSSAGIPTDQLKLGPLTTATPSAHPEASAEGFDREVASWVSGAKAGKGLTKEFPELGTVAEHSASCRTFYAAKNYHQTQSMEQIIIFPGNNEEGGTNLSVWCILVFNFRLCLECSYVKESFRKYRRP
eukprot:scaffold125525_cov15-Tisochrysis_lutea.AAC.1